MAKKASKPKGPTPVETIRHKDARVNIPTEELRDFVAEDEKAPTRVLYPRDPTASTTSTRRWTSTITTSTGRTGWFWATRCSS
jgi:hypothetical protein